MTRSRVLASLMLGSLILAGVGQSTAQVRYVDEQGVASSNGPQITGKENTGSSGSSNTSFSSGAFRPDAVSGINQRAIGERDALQRAAPQERERQLAEQKRATEERQLLDRCNSVRSDQATPALLAQCEQLFQH